MNKYFLIFEYEDYGGMFSSNIITEIEKFETEEEYKASIKNKPKGITIIKGIYGKELDTEIKE
jgi:hypothetical protein